MMEKLSAEELRFNLREIRRRLVAAAEKSGRREDEITLLAATKTVDVDTINEAVADGVTHIGENRVQELLAKYEGYAPCHRHFIGHLQTNKVKDIIDKVEMIESVSSLKLAAEISKQAQKRGMTMKVLAEVNIGGEESKSGFAPEELEEALRGIAKTPGLSVEGLMAIPPAVAVAEDSRKYFQKMYKLFIDIRRQNIDNINMSVLSMGMSSDFDIAVEEGATLVRVGTALFGKRV
ncbi:MAG: YggS family pyridoxal phosphate-dependent enzyme [Clostridia bacterium]|nr:YggS family pyridoxal phosphate-dependent enzyme [Clostridia bacterium]